LVCANQHVLKADKELADNPFWYKANEIGPLELKRIGCSDYEESINVAEARATVQAFNWFSEFAKHLGSGLAITLVVALAVYGLLRAIGWVIGGFVSRA
jgi:hypothetical protein